MPEKRSGTHRVNVFLTDGAYQAFTSYVSTNYSSADAYGAKSEVINNAVSFYCASTIPEIDSYVPSEEHVDDEVLVKRTIEEVKKENV